VSDKPDYEKVPYPPFRKGTVNRNNTETFHRRDTHDREMDNDHVSNEDSDRDYYRNLKVFSGNRCDDQRAEPTRDNTPTRRR
jgi:hypothetical protein